MPTKKSYLVICNTIETESLISELNDSASITLVTKEKELEALTSDDFKKYDCAIVTAELAWLGHNPDDFYGFDVAVSLRLQYRLLTPICILSFMPKVYFSQKTDIKFNILRARGTVFSQLPTDADTMNRLIADVIPLSQATLAYLSNLLVNIKHLIDHLRHAFRLSSSHDAIAEALKELDLLSASSIYPKACNLASEILSFHQAKDEEGFFKSTSEMLALLSDYWQQTNNESIREENSHQTVLLVDDNSNDLQWACKALQRYFNVIPVQNAIDAKERIDRDLCNDIAAIICDWQLLKPESGEQQEMLGFELLEYAARKGHYALFSLTSTDDTSTLEVDQFLWFEHTLITKDFHHDDALWRMYIPIIRQKIEHSRAIIASLPTGESWTSDFKLAYRKEHGKNVAYKQNYTSLKEQYITNRNSEGWHSFESEVSHISGRLWEYYSKAMDADERPLLFDLKTQWGIELNHDIKNVLIIRRLFLAFWFNKTHLDISFRIPEKGVVEDPILNIYSVLRHRYFHEVMEEREVSDAKKVYKDLNNAAKVFANQLAIEPNRLPQGVLPEEKAWLVSIGVKPDHGNDNLYYPE